MSGPAPNLFPIGDTMHTRKPRVLKLAAAAVATILAATNLTAQQVYLSATNNNSPTDAGYSGIGYFSVALNGQYGFLCATGRAYCAFNGNGSNPTGVSNTTPFVFNGGLFEASTYTVGSSSTYPTSVTFVGSDGTNTFTSAPCAINSSSYVFCANTFSNAVTSINFITDGGNDAVGRPHAGYYIADDLTFNGPTQLNDSRAELDGLAGDGTGRARADGAA